MDLLKLKLIFLIVIASFLKSIAQNCYNPPLEVYNSLSGNFGEPRKDHFHMGLDLRTNRQIGLPVFAVSDGYISRISVSPYGYGKTIYLTHSDNYVSLYAHLNDFSEELNKFILNKRKELHLNEIEYDLDNTIFKVKKGDIIGYSGNTGASAGPHLHFEIRNKAYNVAYNPIMFLPKIIDIHTPQIKLVVLYALNDTSWIDKGLKKKIINVLDTKQDLKNLVINAYGEIGVGVEITDNVGTSRFNMHFYSVSITSNDVQIYKFINDSIEFSQKDLVLGYVDEIIFNKKKEIIKLFYNENEELNLKSLDDMDGRITINPNQSKKIQLKISDFSNNSSYFNFELKGKEYEINKYIVKENERYGWEKVNNFSSSNLIEKEKLKVFIPKGSFFNTIEDLKIEVESPKTNTLSSIYTIKNENINFVQNISLILEEKIEDKYLLEKVFLGKIEKNGYIKWHSTKKINDNFITFIKKFGKYALFLDTIPPKIYPINFYSGKDMTNENGISFRIVDNLSGIKSYNLYIDDVWLPLDFSPRTRTVKFDFKYLETNNHKIARELKLLVKDNENNDNIYNTIFLK